MKIVILADGIPPDGKGGAERIAWESARMLLGAGHQVSIITTTRDLKTPTHHTRRSVVEGIQVFEIPTSYHIRWRAWRALYNPWPVKEVRRIVKQVRPDIVHAHNIHLYLSYGSLKVARAGGARIFHTIHDVMPFNYGKLTDLQELSVPVIPKVWNYKISPWHQLLEQRLRYNPFRNFFIRRALAQVDVLFAVSEALAEALRQNGIQNVQVLYNGVSSAEWHVVSEQVSKCITEHALEGKKALLFGGRITRTKGGDELLAVLPEIVKKVPETVLLILGMENEYVQELRIRADAAGIGPNIRVTGWLSGDELHAAYHAAYAIVVPSMCFDSLPTVVLEAMACAKPVIGSCVGGIPEMVQDGATGYIVHPRDAATFAGRCLQLLEHEERARSFGAAGATRQEELFSEKKHLESLLLAYELSLKDKLS